MNYLKEFVILCVCLFLGAITRSIIKKALIIPTETETELEVKRNPILIPHSNLNPFLQQQIQILINSLFPKKEAVR